MTEEKKKAAWWDRMRSTRMAMEGILFEKEVFSQADKSQPKMWKGLLGILILALFQSALLTQWIVRDTRPLMRDEALRMSAVLGSIPDRGPRRGAALPHRTSHGPPQADAVPAPPLYYWSLAPAVRIFPGHPEWGAALTNSFYAGLICLFVFLIVRRDRTDPSGWLAACFISCAPFMLEMSRSISPDIACAAWVAGAYACYLWSDDFDRKWWSYGFGLCCAAGFLTDPKFLFYIVVLAPAFFRGILQMATQRNCMIAAAIVAVVNVPWYWVNSFPLLAWFLTPLGNYFQGASPPGLGVAAQPASTMGAVFWHFWGCANSLYLPFFLIGIFSMAWMLAAEFMPYSKRKLVFLWLAVPYIIWSIFPDKDARYFFPAIVAFAPAVGVMTPPKIRKALAGIFLLFAASHQLGLLSPRVFMLRNHAIPVLGSFVRPVKEDWKHGDIIALINSARLKAPEPVNVAVIADAPFLNAQSLSWSAVKSGAGNLTFRDASKGYFGLSEFVLHRSMSDPTPPGEVTPVTGEDGVGSGWFSRGYGRMASFDLPDGSSADLYRMKKMDVPPFKSRSYRVSSFSSGDLISKDVSIKLGPWDTVSRVYSYAVIYCPNLSVKGLDVYGLKVKLENFTFVPVVSSRISNIRFLSIERVKILSGSVTEYSLQKFLRSNIRGLKNLKVRIGDWIFFYFSCGPFDFSSILEAYILESSMLRLRVAYLAVGGISMPAFLRESFSWTFHLNRMMNVPFRLEMNKLSVQAGSLKAG